MTTLKISISDEDYKRFGLSKEELSLSEFIDLLQRALVLEKHERVVNLAKSAGLDRMSMDEINAEIKQARLNDKGSH